MTMDATTGLADLVRPLSADQFFDAYWTPGRFYLSQANPDLVARVRAISRLSTIEAFLADAKLDVHLFGPNSFRAVVRPKNALDFLANGYNLYVSGIEVEVPEAQELFRGVASDLGVAPWQLCFEAFAGRKGGVSSRHFDHDINFQIVLDGEKSWQLEENRNIRNPLVSYHGARNHRGERAPFREVAYADDPNVSETFDESQCQRVIARAGTVLFLPRGYWHETHAHTATWGINVVIKGVTWAMAFSQALQNRLHRQSEFRAFFEGVAHETRTLSPSARAQADERFVTLRAAAMQALEQISLEEAALAPVDEE